MPQVSLYIEQDVLDDARRNAHIEKISLSKYVSRTLSERSKTGWPEGYWNLFGALEDETFSRPADIPFNQTTDRVAFS